MPEAVLFTGGSVFTGHRWCEALVIEDGRVVAAGTEDEARRARPAGAERVELLGGLLVPGLIDCHVHLAELTRFREGLDLSGVRSIVELVERAHRWAEAHPDQPVVGRGWSADRLSEGRWPTAADLDRASGNRPVMLFHASGHAVVANHAALEAAGIGRTTPDPPGGRVARTADGTPTGALYESAQQPVSALAVRAFPPAPEGLARTLEYAASLGLTTVATMNTWAEEWQALERLSIYAPLPVRVRSYVRLARSAEFPSPAGAAGGRCAIVGVKGFTDGAFGPRTAWLDRPYSDEPRETGLPVGTEDELRTALDAARSRGFAPALHAIGDRALGRALALLDAPRPDGSAPPRVEHAALTPPGLWPALDRVRPVLVVQPGFVWSDSWLGERLGAERARWAYAFRTLIGRGHHLAGSSDAPYDALDPWRGLRAAVSRTEPGGGSANPTPEESLRTEEAFRMYTVEGGVALGDPRLGSLEVGDRADLLLLRASRLEDALAAGSGAVAATWVDGVRAYRAPDARISA